MERSSETVRGKAESEEVLTQIRRLDQLPAFPTSASAIMEQCEKSDSRIGRIIELIECDPAICTKLLSMANSPLYGSSRPVSSVGQAVVLLGLKSVSQMAIAVAANAVFGEGSPLLEQQRKKAFAQSLSCATLSRLVAKHFRCANPDEAFLAGVVHDVGKLVFFKIVPDLYCEILEQHPSGLTIEPEQKAIGVSHAEVGKDCGVRWGLPQTINQVILNHHEPIQCTRCRLTQTVIASNYYARKWQVGFSPAEALPADEEIENAFPAPELLNLKDEFFDHFAAVEEIYLT